MTSLPDDAALARALAREAGRSGRAVRVALWTDSDLAAVAVSRAAGPHASRLDGTRLQFNRPDPYLLDLLICTPELVGPILAHAARTASDVVEVPEVSPR